MGARPGMVAPKSEPVTYVDGPDDGTYADLRLWVSAVVRRGASVEQGYTKITPRGRTVRAQLLGKIVGVFVQYRNGTYTATQEPRYSHEGWGYLDV